MTRFSSYFPFTSLSIYPILDFSTLFLFPHLHLTNPLKSFSSHYLLSTISFHSCISFLLFILISPHLHFFPFPFPLILSIISLSGKKRIQKSLRCTVSKTELGDKEKRKERKSLEDGKDGFPGGEERRERGWWGEERREDSVWVIEVIRGIRDGLRKGEELLERSKEF